MTIPKKKKKKPPLLSYLRDWDQNLMFAVDIFQIAELCSAVKLCCGCAGNILTSHLRLAGYPRKYTHTQKKQLRNTADSTKSCYIWFKSVSGWIFSLSYWQCLDLWQPFFFEWHENGVAIQIIMAHILVMSLKTFAYLLNCWIKMEPCPQLRMQPGAVEEGKKKREINK